MPEVTGPPKQILRTVRMPRALWERLQAFAEVWDMSASKMAQKAIRRFMRLRPDVPKAEKCPDEVTPRLQGLPGGIGPEAITPAEIRYALESYLDEHEGEEPTLWVDRQMTSEEVKKAAGGWFDAIAAGAAEQPEQTNAEWFE